MEPATAENQPIENQEDKEMSPVAVPEEVKEGASAANQGGKQITDNFLCIVGIMQHMVEKDLIKFLKKGLPSIAANLPLKGVQKKRGQNFGFLQFADREQ